MKRLRVVMREKPERINDMKYSIPGMAQKDFIEALSILWIQELRKYFQRAILPENIERSQSQLATDPIGMKPSKRQSSKPVVRKKRSTSSRISERTGILVVSSLLSKYWEKVVHFQSMMRYFKC